ncbi:MAG: hypothetical protein ACHQM6_02205 [Candidatus Kapaibacterium sp.]
MARPSSYSRTIKDTLALKPADTVMLSPNLALRRMSGLGMPGAVLLSVTMSEEGSGTSWHPESSPIYALMYHGDEWMSMIHGHISLRYTNQGSSRGDHAIDAPNYLMAMTQRMIGSNTQIMFRSMLSFDKFTEGGSGYPLLLQTGETWNGRYLFDRQHPHDFFSELSTSLSTEFSESLSGFLYLGYPGEPAIGPPAFMHRLSAMSNPDAPITHHWQDATHITFGVATIGIACGRFKLEGSLFTGAAPDENRLNFDKPLFDSYSGRISYNPSSETALQFSRAFLKNPDRDFSNEWLSTASAIYTHVFNSEEEWISNTLVWSSKKSHHSLSEQQSVLAESEFHFLGNMLYGRFEYVEKSQAELVIGFNPLEKEPLKELTFGVNRKLFDLSGVDLDLGIQGTVNFIPANIAFVYGDEYPKAFEVFLSFHPKMYGLH